MLNTLIEFALARRWLMLALALVLAGYGRACIPADSH